MSWGQGQGGYQYPQQTGYGQQQQPIQQMQTGFPGQSGFLQPQRTGYQAGYQQQQGQPPPVPPIPQNFQAAYQQQPQQQFQSNNGGLAPAYAAAQQQRFLSPSPAMGGPIAAQPTGYGMGGMAPLTSQPTGFMDPRLRMMSNTFMPANISAPYAPSGVPQFAGGPPGDQSLQQSFQQHNQDIRGTAAPKVPWALSKDERKNYDQIFRAWDTSSSGFIDGQMAGEVFGQSGLDRNDLATIWGLADADNRGKLNIQEFHVAMGLIYRRLNGNELPSILPPELVPVSSKNLGESVDFLKDLLRNDAHTRESGPAESKGKVNSFGSSRAPQNEPRKDGSMYQHNDNGVRGYTSSKRRIDRDAIRSSSGTREDDLSDIKRQLASTGDRLDKARAEAESRTAEDDALDEELDDLKYRARRFQEDIDRVNRGPRSTAKDSERRKLERELYDLMYKDVPAVEKKIEERERRKAREKEEWNRDRNERNDRYRSRYDDSPSRRDRDRDRDSDRDVGRQRRPEYDEDDEERERGYMRGTFDRERDAGESSRRNGDRRRDDDYPRRDRDRTYDRRDSPPPAARSPAPPPPTAPAASLNADRPPAPAPSASPAPQTKAMTPAERSAFIRQQAQQRLQERMRALGVSGPAPSSTSSPVDSTVEDRLAQDRKEAEEKAQQAEKAAEEREAQRKARLEDERASKAGAVTPKPSVAPVIKPASVNTSAKAPPPPPPAKKGSRAPPPPRPAQASRAVALTPPVAIPPPAAPVEDDADIELRRREEALKKKRADRLAELERLEAEARREEEEQDARMAALRSRRVASPPAVTNGNVFTPKPATPPAPAVSISPTPPPPTPAPPPAPQVPSPATATRTNPFHKLTQQNSAASTPSAAAPSSNPWSSSGTQLSTSTPPVAPPPPPPPPAPPMLSLASGPKSVSTRDLDDWEDVVETGNDSDSSDDDIIDRNRRVDIANQIFGRRPPSAASNAPGAPTPPAAPPAPKLIPVINTNPEPGPSDINALLSSIASAPKLRKAVTNDRSASQFAGAVVGGVNPPTHINTDPREPSPPPSTTDENMSSLSVNAAKSSNSRMSVDWYAGLASDALSRTASSVTYESTISEGDETDDARLPDINVHAPAEANYEEKSPATAVDSLADVDMSVSHLVRTLYPYHGQRAEDLGFGENLTIQAHPSKSGGDWWYGTLLKEGITGFFPKSYIVVVDKVSTAKAMYTYVGGSVEELPFSEGDILSIVEQEEGGWWKADKGGVVFLVPSAYLELIDSSG